MTAADKGHVIGGECARTACDTKSSAVFYNKSTRLYYCGFCARRINEGLAEPICESVPSDVMRRIHDARYAMSRLTPEERASVFRQLALCSCATLGRVARVSPSVTAGAVIGGLVGAIVDSVVKRDEIEPAPSPPAPRAPYFLPLPSLKRKKK